MIDTKTLQVFIFVKQTGSISAAARELSLTRQTVQRLIKSLEHDTGHKVFQLKAGKYQLAPKAESTFQVAKSIVEMLDGLDKRSKVSLVKKNGLEHVSAGIIAPEQEFFCAQQYSASVVQSLGTNLIKSCFQAWGESNTYIKHPKMRNTLAHSAVYRRTDKGWICTEMGPKSGYALWFGRDWAESAVGKLSEDDQVGSEFNRFIARAYLQIFDAGGVRYDHVYATLPRQGGNQTAQVGFQRLLLGSVFPDGTPALCVVVAITNKIQIASLKSSKIQRVPSEFIMDDF